MGEPLTFCVFDIEGELTGQLAEPNQASWLGRGARLEQAQGAKNGRLPGVVSSDEQRNWTEFDRSTVTGAEIRSKAGVPNTDDLTRLVHGKPVGGNIAPSDRIEIKDGEHFLAAPTGVVS